MTLTDASDDDLIAEVQHRLDASRFGFHGLMARNQMDFRNRWEALSSELWKRANASPDGFVRWNPTIVLMGDLANEQLHDGVVFPLSTTRYGREDCHGQ